MGKNPTELKALRMFLESVMPQDVLAEWLRKPNPAFENRTPQAMMEAGDTEPLWRMVNEIKEGTFL